jgi:hypothetical protein
LDWEIEYTDQFEEWWNTLSAEEQESIAVYVGLLETLGPIDEDSHGKIIQCSKK